MDADAIVGEARLADTKNKNLAVHYHNLLNHANMELLNGVNFSKGCFVGQEVVSRMKRMTTVKKRMRGIIFEGEAQSGDRILAGERVIGDILHTHGKMGMAMIRLDRLRAAEHGLTLNGAPVTVMKAVDGLDH